MNRRQLLTLMCLLVAMAVLSWGVSPGWAVTPMPNPGGPAAGMYRVTRGGGWSPNGVEDLTRLRASDREKYDPQNSYPNLGFRCVLPAGK